MRILLTSDWHIGDFRNGPEIKGRNGRLLDIVARIKEVLSYAVKNQIELLVIAGDIFRDKHPHPIHMQVFSTVLQRLIQSQLTSIILVGNHDRERSRLDAHALLPFMPLVHRHPIHIIDVPQVCQIGDLEFVMCPYMGNDQDDMVRKTMAQATKPAPIVVLHGVIQGSKLNPLIDFEIPTENSISRKTLATACMVMAGDMHMNQNLGNVYYPGSLERLDFGDELTTKGFLDVTIVGKDVDTKFVPVQARKMMSLEANQIKDVEAGTIDIKDAIIRVSGVNKNDVQDTRKILAQKGAYFVTGIHTLEHKRQEVVKSGVNLPAFIQQFADKTKYDGNVNVATQRIQELLDANI